MIPRIPLVPQNRPIKPHQMRSSGWILVVLGLFLMGLMGILLGMALELFTLSALFPGVYRDPTAPQVQLHWVARLLIGFFSCFGLVIFVEGFWRLYFGKTNPKLMILILLMGNLFIAAGLFARAMK